LIIEISNGNGTLFLHNLVEFVHVQALWSVICLRCKQGVYETLEANFDVWKHTRRNIVARFDGDVVGEFNVIDVLEDRKPLANRGDANLLERVGVEDNEDIACDVIL
jgi:hypothetical protein